MLESIIAVLAANNGNGALGTILWTIAAVLVIAGIFAIVRGAILWDRADRSPASWWVRAA